MSIRTQFQFQPQPFRVGPLSLDAVIIGLLGSLTLIGAVAGLGRLVLGLAASTGLNDAYSWGIWIGFDFTLIAFAGVGFTMAFVVHVLHLHHLQPLLRPALLAGFAGYVAVLLLLVLDLGRPDRFYNFLLYWNLHSPLFEISWCVLLYTTVLTLEISPDLFRRLGWHGAVIWVGRLMAPVTILGVTLSSLHQSTLGTLYLNMPHRLDPLWYTQWLPVLFFTSSVMAGFSLGLLVYKLACRVQARPENPAIVTVLGRGMVGAALLYGLLKVADLVVAGEIDRLLTLDSATLLMATELVLCLLAPALLWLPAVRRRWAGVQWIAPMLFLAGVGVNRFNVTLFIQKTPFPDVYLPHILEWLSTFGILGAAALAWYLGVRFLIGPLDAAH